MFNIVVSLLAFILAIGILVTFHEFGHFWVARRVGVKVLRFSIGFGPMIWSHRAKDGVVYCVSAIPLGGYVKLLGEHEDEILPGDIPFALTRQSLWKRMAIVLAGPVFNFVLAWILILVVTQIGMRGTAPVIGEISPGSPAAKAGLHIHDEIIAVGGEKTPTAQSVMREIIKYIDSNEMSVRILEKGVSKDVQIQMPALNAQRDKDKDAAKRIGFEMTLPARIGEVKPGSPAEKAGLEPGDQITAIDGKRVKDWESLVSDIIDKPNQSLKLTVLHHHQEIERTVIPEEKLDGKGQIGVTLDKHLIRDAKLGLRDGLAYATSQTWNYSVVTLKMMYYVVAGKASTDNISGPVTIAKVAGQSIQVGVSYFLDFLAIVSISLGVINLLPIPILDGGHLLYYIIEGIRGKPVSEFAQKVGFQIGLLILISLMLLAFYNDFTRLTVS